MFRDFLTFCSGCGHRTTKKYAREHGGQCKGCVKPEDARKFREYLGVPTRNERLIDSGYQAYAREEGYYG